ncbi:MAG: DEAD/DEAH box helicase [Prevotella sp.]|nr:DEAD/DEAH box helicase [Prevotella sp.]
MKTFEELGLSPQLLQAIGEMGFEQPMPVQEAVLPLLLGTSDAQPADMTDMADTQPSGQGGAGTGFDLIALAQTGTGKTAAFGLPLLQWTDTSLRQPQALVLSPTRELCVQIADDLRDMGRYMSGLHVEAVYGGASIVPQMKAVRRGPQIIVATPGRLLDMMNRGVADMTDVTTIVLDEADEMLNMGFKDSLDAILDGLPEQHRSLLFSATMSREVERVARTYLKDPRQVVVGSRNEGAEHVNHIYYVVAARDRYNALKRVVDFHPKIFAIIFCRTKAETQEVADHLIRDGYNAEPLHGDLSQDQRDLVMQKFRQHTVQLLVATDVAARGLDVDDLTHVINYSLPDDIENYTHRSGRTGRAGKRGTSISIIHQKELYKIKAIEREIGKTFQRSRLPQPEEICQKQLYRVMDKIEKQDVDEEQIAPFMPEIMRHFEFVDKEDLLKKLVTLNFGRFLAYYADAPAIEEIEERRKADKTEKTPRKGSTAARGRAAGRQAEGPRAPEQGYRRLFVNLGKADGFYPGEVMQMLNRHLGGRQQVGHIDLMDTISFIEVPERDAGRVMAAIDGIRYHGRNVRCNDADQGRPQQRRTERTVPKAFERFAKPGRQQSTHEYYRDTRDSDNHQQRRNDDRRPGQRRGSKR